MTTTFILGGTTLDLFASGAPRIPTIDAGEEFTGQSLVHLQEQPIPSIGGNGGNAALALSRLGHSVRLVTALGHDLLGCIAESWLVDAGCDMVRLPPERTSVNVVATDAEHRRVSFFYPVTIDSAAAVAQLERMAFTAGDQLLLAGYPHPADEVLLCWAERAHAQGMTVWLDIGPSLAGFTRDRLAPLLSCVDVVLCNKDELTAIDRDACPDETTRWLTATLDGHLVVKAGADGAECWSDTAVVSVPAIPVTPAGSVGAGDVFNAGLMRSAGWSDDPAQRPRFAVATAAIMLERGRGALGTPTYDEVVALMNTSNDTQENRS